MDVGLPERRPRSTDPRSAIDEVPVVDLVVSPCRCLRDVPFRLREAYACAVSRVCSWVDEASCDETRARALLWYLSLHLMLLRRSPKRAGAAAQAAIARRFKAFAEGRYDVVVDAYVRDLRVVRQLGPHMSDVASDIVGALRLAESNELSRACRALNTCGISDVTDPAVLAQVLAKHPETPPAPEAVELRDVYRTLRRKAGVGPDQLRNEFLAVLALPFPDNETARRAIDQVNTLETAFVRGELPDWYYLVSSAIPLIGLIAPMADGPPILGGPKGIGSARQRATSRCVVSSLRDDVLREETSCQGPT